MAVLAVLAVVAAPARAIDSAAVRRLFADPPREYATAPLWVWNDDLTEAQIRDTLRDLAGQRVKQVFVHPRPGLMTPYLSADWFRLWRVALDEAERLDMNVWIYDENSYPSGFAGGWVPELMPESRGLGLELKTTEAPPGWTTNTVAVFRVEGERVEEISEAIKAGAAPAAGAAGGRYVAATIRRAGDSPWHGNRCYVNLLTRGVTEKFIEVTFEAYKRELGSHFGRRIPGIFTDEPNIRPAGGFPWCADLPEEFEKRWGYSLLKSLPSLELEVGEWRRVRHNYFATLNDLFIERWAKPCYEWCTKNRLEFTGHYWDHEWPHCLGVPNNMAMAAWQQRPGIDTLMNQYAEHTHAQFGNVRFCREISSIANQLGRKRTLVECYGAGGWDLRFEDMKRIGDWLGVLGINTFDEHLSYITLRGARKRDHPQSFSYHEPWWEAYHVSASYLTRLSCALSQGEQINRILVIEPTTTAWMYQGNEARLRELGDAFFKFLLELEAAQIEYDLGDEDVIARFGRPGGAQVVGTGPAGSGGAKWSELVIGQRNYHTVVFPPRTENVNRATKDLLDQIVCRQWGRPSNAVDGRAVAGIEGRDWNDPNLSPERETRHLIEEHLLRGADGIAIRRIEKDPGILFHHRRRLDDGETLFLVNTSIERRSQGTVLTPFKGVEQWNLDTGAVEPYPFTPVERGASARFDLPPSGSLLLFLTDRPVSTGPFLAETVTEVAALGETEIQRLEPNVLTLDYVDIAVGGEARTDQYVYAANQFAWRQNGTSFNPWDSAVQFKDQLITRTFPAESGFEAAYHFTIEGEVPSDLAIAIERPDLYTIACNGQPVRARRGSWWLDKSFGRLDIAAAARTGTNTVTLTARPFTVYHELEAAYVLGDFSLEPSARGWSLVPPEPLRLAAKPEGGWDRQGLPFYSAAVAYRQRYRVDRKATAYRVGLSGWYGSVAQVRVNGDLAGYIAAPPWELDVTRDLVVGENTIEVAVIGTLKNTLGPHHGKPPLGSAWPGMFQKGPANGPPPGAEYDTVGYGLFEPFALRAVKR